MSDLNNKGEKWVRYILWFIAGVLAAFGLFKVYCFITQKIDNTVPTGYDYMIEDHFAKSDVNWATYYIYSDYVAVKKDGEEEKDAPALIYDGIGSSTLTEDKEETVKKCDADSCFAYPKVLITIKNYIANKFGREYTGR